jgi:CIC family chloride channel protein
VLVGIIGGFGSWVFRFVIDTIFYLFFTLPSRFLDSLGLSSLDWLPFLIAPVLGGVIVGFLTNRVSKETKGHGVPEVLESVSLRNGKMNLRVPFIKIVASATTIGTGGSAGREGPIAQIGAGFGSLLGQKLDLPPKTLRTLVVAGVAAGIASTFNAPIGGALFAIEILLGEGGGTALFIPIIIASVVGVVVGQLLLGSNPAFIDFPQLEYHDPFLIPLFIGLGLICGIFSALWIKFFYKSEDLFEFATNKKLKIPSILNPAIGGLFVGLILVLTYFVAGDQWEMYSVMGLTYFPMDAIFQGLLLQGPIFEVLIIVSSLFFLKAIATVFTVGSGGSGGVFAPTLFLGVMLGAIYGIILGDIINIANSPIALLAVLGMAAFFAGTGRAPLTAIIMTAEMTNDYFLTIPLMIVVIIGYVISIFIEKENIYTLKLIRRGVSLKDQRKDILDTLTVEDAMTPGEKIKSISIKSRLEEVLNLVKNTKHEGFPVIDDGKLLGVVTLSDIHNAIASHPKDWNVGNILENKPKEKSLICTHKNAPLTHAVAIMERHDISRLPVVEKIENGQIKLVGWITNHDITHSFISAKATTELEKIEEYFVNYPDIIKK